MGSSTSNRSFCPIRKLWVASTPEEIVRQGLIGRMLHSLGYPKGLLSVEKGISEVTLRRIDLLCFYPAQEGLNPLLLIECKAGPLNQEAENQLFGYNATVKAPFVCLVNETEIRVLWRENGKVACVPFLPSYSQLLEKVCL